MFIPILIKAPAHPKFVTGRLVCTANANSKLDDDDIKTALARHLARATSRGASLTTRSCGDFPTWKVRVKPAVSPLLSRPGSSSTANRIIPNPYSNWSDKTFIQEDT